MSNFDPIDLPSTAESTTPVPDHPLLPDHSVGTPVEGIPVEGIRLPPADPFSVPIVTPAGQPANAVDNRITAGACRTGTDPYDESAAIAREGDPSAGPMGSSHHEALKAANARYKSLRRVERVASFNGWVTGIFAACSWPFAFFSIGGFAVAVGLTIVAYNEFRGREMVRSYDARAGQFLGRNQLGFLALIISYCVWQVIAGLMAPNPIDEMFRKSPSLGQLGITPDEFAWMYYAFLWGTYITVIVLSLIFQGYNAYYYFRSGKKLQAYLDETEPWIVELQKTMRTSD